MSENPYAGQGSVLLDIGGDVGAIVVEMPASMTGREVEIRPAGSGAATGHHHRPHVAVVARPVGSGTLPSLVFPEVVEGRYELYEKDTSLVELSVTVEGGQVTEATWPA